MHAQRTSGHAAVSPFDLGTDDGYRPWRAERLRAAAAPDAFTPIGVTSMCRLNATERDALAQRCARHNMALYHSAEPTDSASLLAFGRQLGLHRLDRHPFAGGDGVAVISAGARPGEDANEFIPYTDKALNWHTDGYYNLPEQAVRAVIMHCVSSAASGGETTLLDPELVYIRIRDEDARCVRALTAPDALTIPARVDGGVTVRPARTGPVFRVDPRSGRLLMRYTIRRKHVAWKRDRVTIEARELLIHVLESGIPGMQRIRLAPGQGIVCNNVLHARAAFADDRACRVRRVLLRARYLDRIGPE